MTTDEAILRFLADPTDENMELVRCSVMEPASGRDEHEVLALALAQFWADAAEWDCDYETRAAAGTIIRLAMENVHQAMTNER